MISVVACSIVCPECSHCPPSRPEMRQMRVHNRKSMPSDEPTKANPLCCQNSCPGLGRLYDSASADRSMGASFTVIRSLLGHSVLFDAPCASIDVIDLALADVD